MRYILLACLLFAIGCGGPTRIDGSSQDAYLESLDEIRSELDPAATKEFNRALARIAFPDSESVFAAASNPQAAMDATRERLAGKTASEVIAEAEALQPLNGIAGDAFDAAERAADQGAK